MDIIALQLMRVCVVAVSRFDGVSVAMFFHLFIFFFQACTIFVLSDQAIVTLFVAKVHPCYWPSIWRLVVSESRTIQ